MPNPAPRCTSGIRDCFSVGTEIAHWLFWQTNTTGAAAAAAKTIASLTSPCEVAPSPK